MRDEGVSRKQQQRADTNDFDTRLQRDCPGARVTRNGCPRTSAGWVASRTRKAQPRRLRSLGAGSNARHHAKTALATGSGRRSYADLNVLAKQDQEVH